VRNIAIVDAPEGPIYPLQATETSFGRVIGGTIDYGGNGTFHYDLARRAEAHEQRRLHTDQLPGDRPISHKAEGDPRKNWKTT